MKKWTRLLAGTIAAMLMTAPAFAEESEKPKLGRAQGRGNHH